jgi:hypothetical protein
MPNTNLLTLEEQVRRVRILTTIIEDIKENSALSPAIERELIYNGFADIIDEVKLASREQILVVLETTLQKETVILKNYWKVLNEKFS